MARRFYENGRQFTDTMELAQIIAEVLDNLSEQHLKDLYEAIPDRLLVVYALHGENLKY